MSSFQDFSYFDIAEFFSKVVFFLIKWPIITLSRFSTAASSLWEKIYLLYRQKPVLSSCHRFWLAWRNSPLSLGMYYYLFIITHFAVVGREKFCIISWEFSGCFIKCIVGVFGVCGDIIGIDLRGLVSSVASISAKFPSCSWVLLRLSDLVPWLDAVTGEGVGLTSSDKLPQSKTVALMDAVHGGQ